MPSTLGKEKEMGWFTFCLGTNKLLICCLGTDVDPFL